MHQDLDIQAIDNLADMEGVLASLRDEHVMTCRRAFDTLATGETQYRRLVGPTVAGVTEPRYELNISIVERVVNNEVLTYLENQVDEVKETTPEEQGDAGELVIHQREEGQMIMPVKYLLRGFKKALVSTPWTQNNYRVLEAIAQRMEEHVDGKLIVPVMAEQEFEHFTLVVKADSNAKQLDTAPLTQLCYVKGDVVIEAAGPIAKRIDDLVIEDLIAEMASGNGLKFA